MGPGLYVTRSSTATCYMTFFFSSRRRHTRLVSDWSSDVCSSDLRLHRHSTRSRYAGRQHSVLTLETVGAWRYAADPRTEILCCAYAVDDEPVKLWLPGDPVPPEFFEAARYTDWEVVAHNAQFEIALEHFILTRRYGFPKFPLSRQRCTQAKALACSLPPKLELAAKVLELVHQKDKAGQRLMLMMAKPRRPRKDEDPQALLWFDDEERQQRLRTYNRQD